MARRNENFGLLSLPDVAKRHLCGFLDSRSLVTLRLTCKAFKAFVEQASILANIPIRVTHSKQLQRILDCKVPYNCFILSFKSLEEQSYLQKFGNTFGVHIRKLVITTSGGYKETIRLLAECTQLQDLELDSIDFELLSNSANRITYEKILNNFKNLKRLVIYSINGKDSSKSSGGSFAIESFLKILYNCHALEDFKVPRFFEYNFKHLNRHYDPFKQPNNARLDGDDYDDDWEAPSSPVEPDWEVSKNGRDVLIHPLIDYMQSRASRIENNCRFSIRRIDISEIVMFEWRALLDLLNFCYKHQIKLCEIQSSQFLKTKTEVSLLDPKYFELFETASLIQLHEGFPVFMMKNLRKLHIEIGPSMETANVPEEKLQCILPCLESIRVNFMFETNQASHQPLIRKVFNELKRPSVKRLDLLWNLQKSCSTIKAADLASNFFNVKNLQIHGWDATDSEFILLWSNLSWLECVIIKDCKNMTDRSFVGDYDLSNEKNISQRPLNRLKHLRSLTIRDLTGNVTEISMVGSFKWIKLHRFHFESSVIDKIRLEVYQSMEDSPFGNSIENIFGPRPAANNYSFRKRPFRKLYMK